MEYANPYDNPWQQLGLVLDDVRVSKYAEAIARTVKKGDVVMDVGTGSGLLALLAAKAGASKVYAVERTGAVHFAAAHAKENGFGDVIEVVHLDIVQTPIDALKKRIATPPNVVISELFGTFAPEEGQHAAYERAREVARPDALFLPARYDLVFAATNYDVIGDIPVALRDVQGVSFDTLAKQLRFWAPNRRIRSDALVGPEVVGWSGATYGPPPRTIDVTLPVTLASNVSGVVCTFSMTLAEGITLTTSLHAPETTWMAVFFPLSEVLRCDEGAAIQFHLELPDTLQRRTWTWSESRG